MMKLRTRTIALICLLPIIVGVIVDVSMFLYMFGFPPFYRVVPLTISQINSIPEFWVGKRVCVQGILRGPYVFIPEAAPPYNYVLEDVSTQEIIGILRKGHSANNVDKNVWVIGVVRKGYTRPLIIRLVYYVEAEMIVPSVIS